MAYPDLDPAFGHWLAGFIDGEGTFVARPRRGRGQFVIGFRIQLREDDLAVLEHIQARTGLGRLYAHRDPGRSGSKPVAIWGVQSKAELLRLVEILDQFPLRAKKSRDYTIWREIVHRYATDPFKPGERRDYGPLGEMCAALAAGRAYASAVD